MMHGKVSAKAAHARWLAAVWVGAGFLLALVCFHLPWYSHASAAFTMNAFDLAEWASIHPAVRSSSPPMLTSFLLRLPLVMLAAALALAINLLPDARWRWLGRAVAALLLVRLIPPSDFFGDARDDPNYRQMLLLFTLGVALLVTSLAARRLHDHFQAALGAGLLVVGVLAGWWGLSRAGTLLDNFAVNVDVGPGVWGMTLATAATVVMLVVGWGLRWRSTLANPTR